MRFVTRSDAQSRLDGKSVAIVGSGPGVLDNAPGFVDSHDVVIRVNNYKLSAAAGFRTDVFYSFFGTSIRKTADDLRCDGVTLCWAKCPDAYAIESEWHRRNGKMIGVDYRPHYRRRNDWWFCDTCIPSVDEFLESFNALDRHIPTTGFAAIFEVFRASPKAIYLTGFDGFRSGIHNVDEPWSAKNMDDPFRHEPARELAWVAANLGRHPVTCDHALTAALNLKVAA